MLDRTTPARMPHGFLPALLRPCGSAARGGLWRVRALVAVTLIAILASAAPAQAQGLTPVFGGFYAGAGAAYTDFDDRRTDSPWGARAYAGLDLAEIPATLRLGVEGGVLQTGSFQIDDSTDDFLSGDLGVQGTFTLVPRLDFHARAGYEFGDSDGPFVAGGAAVRLLPMTHLRGEYQLRDEYQVGILSIHLRIP